MRDLWGGVPGSGSHRLHPDRWPDLHPECPGSMRGRSLLRLLHFLTMRTRKVVYRIRRHFRRMNLDSGALTVKKSEKWVRRAESISKLIRQHFRAANPDQEEQKLRDILARKITKT